MNKRSKLAALLGAGLLTFGIVGIASADTLNGSFAGKTIDQLIADGKLGSAEDCAAQFDLDEGEVGVFFVLGGADQADGDLDATFSNPASTPHLDAGTHNQGNNIRWAVTVTGTGSTVLVSAETDATSNAAGDDHLVLSHVCVNAPAGTPTITGQPNDDTIGTSGTSGPTDTAWLLVVALGVLLASIVVLTPARVKNRR